MPSKNKNTPTKESDEAAAAAAAEIADLKAQLAAALQALVLSCLLTLYTAVMSFEILFPFGLWVSEPGWLLNHSQLV